MTRAPITTHVLNLDTGRPAEGVQVALYRENEISPLATSATDCDGRVSQWDGEVELQKGSYQIRFAVGAWSALQKHSAFYPEINISFWVEDTDDHYHVPLLLNAHGYSTYRGS